MMTRNISTILLLLLPVLLFAQGKDNSTLDYNKIYGLALNADARAVLSVLDTAKITSKKDSVFKADFQRRFKYTTDKSQLTTTQDPGINELLQLFRQYWRTALLDTAAQSDGPFEKNLIAFLAKENGKDHFLKAPVDTATCDTAFLLYIASKGLRTQGIGKTGPLYDLLVWRQQTDTTYVIPEIRDTAYVHVHLMDDFISLGWEEYITLGKYYPGGWATPSSLFCVRKAYDLGSEDFRVSYLGHEGQHFLDYKEFPKLSSNDLEYRAKLVELYLAETDLYNTIQFFISNARYDKTNSHPYADFCVIRDMSKKLFGNDSEKNMDKWKGVAPKDIHEAARQLFLQNTKDLAATGGSRGN